MNRHAPLLLWTALSSTVCFGADRAIDVPAKTAMAWGYLTPNSTQVKPAAAVPAKAAEVLRKSRRSSNDFMGKLLLGGSQAAMRCDPMLYKICR